MLRSFSCIYPKMPKIFACFFIPKRIRFFLTFFWQISTFCNTIFTNFWIGIVCDKLLPNFYTFISKLWRFFEFWFFDKMPRCILLSEQKSSNSNFSMNSHKNKISLWNPFSALYGTDWWKNYRSKIFWYSSFKVWSAMRQLPTQTLGLAVFLTK